MANAGKTPEDRLDVVETRVNALNDATIVQGYLQGRLERNLVELSDEVRSLTEFTRTLADHQATIQAALQTLIGRVEVLTDNQATLHAALQGLTETVDRFIRGQQGNGHRQ
jgi:ABC-type transporter Mla subunit MlaD